MYIHYVYGEIIDFIEMNIDDFKNPKRVKFIEKKHIDLRFEHLHHSDDNNNNKLKDDPCCDNNNNNADNNCPVRHLQLNTNCKLQGQRFLKIIMTKFSRQIRLSRNWMIWLSWCSVIFITGTCVHLDVEGLRIRILYRGDALHDLSISSSLFVPGFLPLCLQRLSLFLVFYDSKSEFFPIL